MPSPITIDTETCGLHGMPVLIQWAEGDGDVQLFSPWTNPIRDTLRLVEKFANHPDGLIFFNAVFDWFMLCKIYTTFMLYHDHDEIPENIIDILAELEMSARDGPCLKPVKACDVMLVARKGPYQSTMDRGDIRIRRVPTALAWQLADELERRIKLKDIYFARKKNKRAPKWNIYDIVDSDGDVDVNFKDIVLKFAPSAALKALAVDALGIDMTEILLFGDVEVDEAWYPEELGYAPFAKAIGTRHDWKGAWPEKIRHHIGHWNYHETARRYAADDVKYTRALYYKFGSPPLGDNDSELACMVAAVRWRGFKLDLAKLQALRIEAAKRFVNIPTAPAQVRYYVTQHLDETEKLVLRGSTKKILLEEIAKWLRPCPICNAKANIEFAEGMTMDEDETPTISMETQITVADKVATKDCLVCEGKGTLPHLAAIRAQEVLDARASTKEVEIFDKLIHSGRFHASFKVIGALSSRMSGTDGLNPQGIKKTKEVRSCFPLAWDDMILCGGDFAGFEVTIAVAVYDDENLRKMLLTCEQCGGAARFVHDKNDFLCEKCSGNKQKKIHALFGLHCFPEHTYESLKTTSGTKDDKYTRAKSGVFALMYGGTEFTLADRLGVPVEIGLKALASFHREFPGVRRFQQDIFNSFCSMRQVGGLGTKVEWHEPADYRETMFGFRRYFTLENQICHALFTLANKPPASWRDVKIKVLRRDRVQSASGAVQSSLYGAAFQIQAGNMRAAANHDIQSAGATITKAVQRRVWDLQPSGVGEWIVQPMNIHDEILAPCKPHMAEIVKKTVNTAVEEFREKIPLIKMDWVIGLKSWAEKG